MNFRTSCYFRESQRFKYELDYSLLVSIQDILDGGLHQVECSVGNMTVLANHMVYSVHPLPDCVQSRAAY